MDQQEQQRAELGEAHPGCPQACVLPAGSGACPREVGTCQASGVALGEEGEARPRHWPHTHSHLGMHTAHWLCSPCINPHPSCRFYSPAIQERPPCSK